MDTKHLQYSENKPSIPSIKTTRVIWGSGKGIK